MTRLTSLRALAMALALAALPLAAGPALAHAELTQALPAIDATVTAPLPTELRLSFSEPIELVFTRVVITGENGLTVELGKLALDPADPKTLIVPLAGALAAGTAKVEWTTVATDGHKSNGSYTLTVAP